MVFASIPGRNSKIRRARYGSDSRVFLGTGTLVPDSVFDDSVRHSCIQAFADGENTPRQRFHIENCRREMYLPFD